VNCQSYNSTLRLIHTALKYLFQLCEDLICRHTGCQQLLQHILSFGFLCGFRCFGFGFDLFSFNSGDFLIDRFQLSFLGFQVSFQRIDISGDGFDFSSSGFLWDGA
jgi:hypothetical protein